MYEQLTDRARNVLLLANQEAQRFHHEYIGTEHLLLGLIAEDSGVAVQVLQNLNLNPNKVRQEVEKILQAGPDLGMRTAKQPLTPRGRSVFQCAQEESQKLGHEHVDTEHILLGLIREVDGVAGAVLQAQGLTLSAVRDEILSVLKQSKTPENHD